MVLFSGGLIYLFFWWGGLVSEVYGIWWQILHQNFHTHVIVSHTEIIKENKSSLSQRKTQQVSREKTALTQKSWGGRGGRLIH